MITLCNPMPLFLVQYGGRIPPPTQRMNALFGKLISLLPLVVIPTRLQSAPELPNKSRVTMRPYQVSVAAVDGGTFNRVRLRDIEGSNVDDVIVHWPPKKCSGWNANYSDVLINDLLQKYLWLLPRNRAHRNFVLWLQPLFHRKVPQTSDVAHVSKRWTFNKG